MIPNKTSLARVHARKAAALAAGACAVLMLAVPTGSAQAQAAGGAVSTKPISLTFQNAPIQAVLKTLFSSVGVNNSIDPNVQGTVNIDVRDVSFDVALRQLLRAANPPLSYDITDGVYHISVKNNNGPDPNTQQPAQAQSTAPLPEGYHAYRIPIDHYDAAYIASLLSKARGGLTVVMPNFVYASGGGQGGGQGGRGGGGQGGGFGGGGGGGIGGGGGGFGGGGGGIGGGGGFGGGGGGGIGGGIGGF